MVEAFRTRPLDAGPYTYVWVDGLTMKVREGGRIVNVVVVVATGVNADGNREVLGLDVVTSDVGAGWLAFLRSLVARGLSGVQLVISDCHEGLRQAIAAVLPGATWQRCRTHFMRNLLTKVPKASQSMVATSVRTIFEQPDAEQVWAQQPASSTNSKAASPTPQRCSSTQAATSWPSPPFPSSTGQRSARTTRRND